MLTKPRRSSRAGAQMELASLEVFALSCNACSHSELYKDPRWANPIKNRVRQNVQARAVNEVVNALKPSVLGAADNRAPLRVINGMSTPTASSITMTTAATAGTAHPSPVDGLPGNSTIRWGGGLVTHAEHEEELEDFDERDIPELPPAPRKPINPSVETLEKAVAAKIFFENLYFPLLRQPPSREQRRLAMERDMEGMQLSEKRKDDLRARWRQNETDYLRERRRKVDVSAFVKLKTIGHGPHSHSLVIFSHEITDFIHALPGAFGVVSLVREKMTGQLYAMKEVQLFFNGCDSSHASSFVSSSERRICYVRAKRAMSVLKGTFSSPRLSSTHLAVQIGLCACSTRFKTVTTCIW